MRREIEAALDALLDRPDEREQIEARIEADFGRERAVLILDMSGFTRETRVHGIVSYLALLREAWRTAKPSVEARGGSVVKTEADNLFCVFEGVQAAVDAALELSGDHDAGIGIGYGRVLDAGDDVWGDEVNLASKLAEDLAVTGTVLLTEAAFAEIEHECEERLASISGLELRYYALS